MNASRAIAIAHLALCPALAFAHVVTDPDQLFIEQSTGSHLITPAKP